MPTQAISPPDAVSVSDRKRGRLNQHGLFVRALWALCLIGFLCACSTTNKLVESKATLWKVKGDHNTMYLLGSIHVLSKHAYPLKPALERAFDDANQVVFEIDLTRFTPRSFRQEFKRTASRLIEMRSQAYLARPHGAGHSQVSSSSTGIVET